MVQSWKNSDNLYLKFGPDKATPNIAGEYVTVGELREVELTITLANLTQSETPLSDVLMLPAGVRIEDVVVVTQSVAATGVAIDLGLIKNSDRSTEVDYDGLLAAFPLASMDTAGEKSIITVGSSFAGALIGTTLGFTSLVTCSATTATAFTTGVIRVRIRYYKP